MTERTEKLYVSIAKALGALQRCRDKSANESQASWALKWEAYIARCAEELPRGSGFDSYPVIDVDGIKPNRIVITGSYHNMDEYGGYCGWSDYKVTVKPDLESGITMHITGGNSDFRDYAYDCFLTALRADYAESWFHDQLVTAEIPRPEADKTSDS